MSQKINSLIEQTIRIYKLRIEAILDRCESEIEKQFLMHFIHFWEQASTRIDKGIVFDYDDPKRDDEYRNRLKGPRGKLYGIKFLGERNKITLIPQYEVKLGGNSYRFDFFIKIIHKAKPNTKICIECDGYDYHYKDVSKVNSDNERTQQLQRHGYHVLRYTGSQINSWRSYEDFQPIINTILLLGKEPSEREMILRTKRIR